MEKIEKLLNFSCEYYQVPHYGQLDEESGTWTGMIRELVDGRSDIALGALREPVKVGEKCNARSFKKIGCSLDQTFIFLL